MESPNVIRKQIENEIYIIYINISLKYINISLKS